MRKLLHECLPRQLAGEIPGHTVVTVQKAGWAGLKNGKLLKNISGQYEVFLTIDKRLERQQQVPTDVAIITIRARSNRIQDLKPLVPEILDALKDAVPGKSALVGSWQLPKSSVSCCGQTHGARMGIEDCDSTLGSPA